MTCRGQALKISSVTEPYPVPFAHAVAAVDSRGASLWEQGDVWKVFPLASVTKILTAVGTLRAVQAGAVTVSSPVGTSPKADPYTVAHLLSHSSGLAVEGDGTNFRARPGERRIYSNQGFDVLGTYLVETLDMPLTRWMDESVYQPLGLRSTVIPKSPARSGFGNAVDLTVLVEELLVPELLDSRLHAALSQTVLPGLRGILPGYGMQASNDWGLGVEVRGRKDPHWTPPTLSPKTFGHFGMSGSFLWVDPTREMGAVFLGEEPFGQWHKDNWPALTQHILDATGR